MKSILFLIVLTTGFVSAHSQGCVAIRSNGSTCTFDASGTHNSNMRGWLFSINNRYFRSFRHFVGKEEQKQREELGTEVINHAFSTELQLTRVVNDRWSMAVFVPLNSNTRSSLYEHDRKNRYETHSFGLGDLRLAAYYWLLDPAKKTKANMQLGLGIKLPTGDYRYQDYFHKTDSTKILGPVDQSIQLGDGGTGITTELNTYYRFNSSTGLYANAYYLFNPREQNGVSTARGSLPSPNNILYGSEVMSVPDQFMFRLGGNVSINQFSVSAGLRIEGLPAHDILGGSNGFRRPGYVLSAEPVVVYSLKKAQVYLSIPYALERNRTQSVPDEKQTRLTGTYSKGDAAFADYSINFGAVFALR